MTTRTEAIVLAKKHYKHAKILKDFVEFWSKNNMDTDILMYMINMFHQHNDLYIGYKGMLRDMNKLPEVV